MAYRPPSNSKWAPAEPMRRNKPNRGIVDEDGWETVGKPSFAAIPAIPAKKPVAPEIEFPTLGSTTTTTPKVASTGGGLPSGSGMTFAERMKIRLAEEEEVRQRKEEEARKSAEERERNRFKTEGIVPLSAMIKSRTARQFDMPDYEEPAESAAESKYYYSEDDEYEAYGDYPPEEGYYDDGHY